jgi:hypothetical protein
MSFPNAFTLTNLASRALALDAKFSEDRALRRSLPVGGSITLAPSDLDGATLDELDRNPQIAQLIADGDLSITMTQGPMVSFQLEVAADAGTDAAGVLLLGPVPFDIRLTQVTVDVPTGVTSSTLTLADAASSGNAYTGAIDTDGTPAFIAAAALTENRVIAKGSSLFGQQSATAKPAVTITLQGMRVSI